MTLILTETTIFVASARYCVMEAIISRMRLPITYRAIEYHEKSHMHIRKVCFRSQVNEHLIWIFFKHCTLFNMVDKKCLNWFRCQTIFKWKLVLLLNRLWRVCAEVLLITVIFYIFIPSKFFVWLLVRSFFHAHNCFDFKCLNLIYFYLFLRNFAKIKSFELWLSQFQYWL